jgi:hypothetical protein
VVFDHLTCSLSKEELRPRKQTSWFSRRLFSPAKLRRKASAKGPLGWMLKFQPAIRAHPPQPLAAEALLDSEAKRLSRTPPVGGSPNEH